MKKMRIMSLLAILLMALPSIAYADELNLEIWPPGESVKAGEEFSVRVELTENPGFYAVQLTLPYDETDMECTEIVLGPLLDGSFSGTNPLRDEGAFVMVASLNEIQDIGELASFYFRAKRDINVFHFSLTDVIFTKEDGKVISYPISVPAQEGFSNEETAKLGRENATVFSDTAGHWAEMSILEATRREFFHGYSDGTFRPDGQLTRAQFMTVLWNIERRPEPSERAPFKDVGTLIPDFQKSIAWAYSHGYIDGINPDVFAPNEPLTRQATMKILFRYSGNKGDARFLPLVSTYDAYFKDSAKLPEWAKAPMYWAVYNEILDGISSNILNPAGIVTRGLLADIIVRYTDSFPK